MGKNDKIIGFALEKQENSGLRRGCMNDSINGAYNSAIIAGVLN